MNDKLKIYIDRDHLWGDTFAVRMARRMPDERWAVAEPIAFRALSEADMGVERVPSFTLNKDDAQAFIDELWNAGFRPTEGSGSAGAMAAVQEHLKDMRRLVFDRPQPPV
jgi:hypothetical protein